MNQKHLWLEKMSGNEKPLFFILGPCALQDEAHTLMLAQELKKLSEQLSFNLIFKGSFDKANRISAKSYRSVGMDEGLRIFEKVKAEFDLPVVTDIHEAWQAAHVADVANVLQVPAFLCRQTDLLLAAGKTGRTVFIKKGQFVRPEKMGSLVDKVASTGNEQVWLGERGFTMGYEDLVVDPRNFPIMKRFGKPVVIDATHSVQRPGQLGDSSGGDRHFVPTIAAAAIVQGIAGIFMEVHEEPEKALCDGPNSVRLSQLPALLRYLVDLDAWAKQRPVPECP
ncbi:3-deoxy-8-phosphooctulonate synthase [Candidatus Babeliales bacterium]|nr:3-deoxy-8-phosphooctulonate synthase [Candidatus Babeliales bacterium]